MIRIGRWSECSACNVFHVMCRVSAAGAVVMSGEVVCCCVLVGFLVGVSVLRVMCVEFCMMFAMWVPLWSSVDECHKSECALMSAVIIVLGSVVRYVMVFSMSVSSVS